MHIRIIFTLFKVLLFHVYLRCLVRITSYAYSFNLYLIDHNIVLYATSIVQKYIMENFIFMLVDAWHIPTHLLIHKSDNLFVYLFFKPVETWSQEQQES